MTAMTKTLKLRILITLMELTSPSLKQSRRRFAPNSCRVPRMPHVARASSLCSVGLRPAKRRPLACVFSSPWCRRRFRLRCSRRPRALRHCERGTPSTRSIIASRLQGGDNVTTRHGRSRQPQFPARWRMHTLFAWDPQGARMEACHMLGQPARSLASRHGSPI